MKRRIFFNLTNARRSTLSTNRKYSHSDFNEYFRFAKSCHKGMNCSCLSYLEKHKDPLLDLQLPWYSLWYIKSKDIVPDDNNYVVHWSHCFSIRSNDYLPIEENESINPSLKYYGPYAHCGKNCCKAIEE